MDIYLYESLRQRVILATEYIGIDESVDVNIQ